MRGEIYLTRKTSTNSNALREEEGLDPFMNPNEIQPAEALKCRISVRLKKNVDFSAVLYQYIAKKFPRNH